MISDKEYQNLHLAFSQFKHIGMCFNLYIDLIEYYPELLNTFIDNDYISKAVFNTFNGSKIWMDHYDSPIHHIQVSHCAEQFKPKILTQWSPWLELADFDRLIKLQGFW